MTPEVILYGRAGCHLCEEARSIIAEVATRRTFSFSERDIESDESLLRVYLERIPVVTIDGVETFSLFVDAAEMTARLDALGAGR